MTIGRSRVATGRSSARTIGFSMVGLVVLWAAPTSAQPVPAEPQGFFTERQANSGQGSYRSICTPCHGDAVVETLANWTGGADTFYAFISSAMPADGPGSLPPETYLRIMAYLLREIGLPPGASELTADPELLRSIDLAAAPAP